MQVVQQRDRDADILAKGANVRSLEDEWERRPSSRAMVLQRFQQRDRIQTVQQRDGNVNSLAEVCCAAQKCGAEFCFESADKTDASLVDTANKAHANEHYQGKDSLLLPSVLREAQALTVIFFFLILARNASWSSEQDRSLSLFIIIQVEIRW